ncbi:hypothetical protein HK096_005152, partial [Nowakowskiella sp. JEL0078]
MKTTQTEPSNAFNTGGVLTQTQVELRFSCRHLRNLDFTSKSDPQIVVYEHNPVRSKLRPSPLSRAFTLRRQDTFWVSSLGPSLDPAAWLEIGRTEIVRDQLSPKFTAPISTPFIFEENQLL